MLRLHVVSAVWKRNLQSYFTGVIGYLFIVCFVVAGAYLAFNERFFTNNLANLDQLNEWFPLLLLFIVPAITMSTWADEKKLGTDELLFTLPASDVEILLGKYLAVLSVYTVTLLFSVTHLLVLAWNADPDWGLLFTTYFGYWISGAALLSAGMFASSLTNSTTVAFVLGAAVCAVPVFIGRLAPYSEFFRDLSLAEQFREFGMGMLPLSGLLYFLSFTLFMLYLNLVIISERHWSGGKQANMGFQFIARALALAAVLISLNALAGHAPARADMTAEKVFSMSPSTRQILRELTGDQQVEVQAFLSPEVPRDYVPVRRQLIGMLRQYDSLGGQHLEVRYVDVQPHSEEAVQAQLFGIEPVRVQTEREGRRLVEDVFLGVVVTSATDEVVIPFFGPGTPIEYELTRSIRTVSSETRRTVGVLNTDAQLMSGSQEWRIVSELKQQYKVIEVSPDAEIDASKFDVLLAVAPSSLTQEQMDNFVAYVKAGRPTLIFDDPFPLSFSGPGGVTMAPRLPKPSPGGGMMMGMRQPPPPKADNGEATTLMNLLEAEWISGTVVFDPSNPHPEFAGVITDEYLFITPTKDNPEAISTKSPITSGLQEVLAIYSGTVAQREGAATEFTPLLMTSVQSGKLTWDQFSEDSFDITRFAPTRRIRPEALLQFVRRFDPYAHPIAAHIKGGPHKLNVVFVADLDMIADFFFDIRTRADLNLNLDNVTFVLNAVDVLAGDEELLNLRKRRAELRTLKRLEEEKARFEHKLAQERAAAEAEANKALEEANERFRKQIEEIRNDSSLDERAKAQRVELVQELEQRKLDVTKANIERRKNRKIDEMKSETERSIRKLENQFRLGAVTLSPLPAILLGVVVLSLRLYNERREITPDRLVRG